jgi:hypothetical protein
MSTASREESAHWREGAEGGNAEKATFCPAEWHAKADYAWIPESSDIFLTIVNFPPLISEFVGRLREA